MNVYDFDNTIYDGESFVDIFKFLIKRDPKLVKFLPEVIKSIYRYGKGTIDAEGMIKEYSPIIGSYFESLDDHMAVVHSFWEKNMYKIKPFYFRLREADDIIVTANFDFLIKDLMETLNIKSYVCSKTDGMGRVDELCFGKNKVKMFRELYPDAVIDNFYTDSVNDTPLMEISEHAFLVTGNKIEQVK